MERESAAPLIAAAALLRAARAAQGGETVFPYQDSTWFSPAMAARAANYSSVRPQRPPRLRRRRRRLHALLSSALRRRALPRVRPARFSGHSARRGAPL